MYAVLRSHPRLRGVYGEHSNRKATRGERAIAGGRADGDSYPGDIAAPIAVNGIDQSPRPLKRVIGTTIGGLSGDWTDRAYTQTTEGQ